MNKSDKLVLTALKAAGGEKQTPASSDPSKGALDQAIAALRTESAKTAAANFFSFLSKGGVKSGTPVPVDDMRSLVSANFTASAEYAFLQCLTGLAEMKFEEVIPILPTSKALQEWLKLKFPGSEPKKLPGVNMVVQAALSDPVRAVETVLAKGFVDLAPLAELPKAASFFIVPRGLRWFTGQVLLLLDALKRDKGAHFLEKLLRDLLKDSAALSETIAVIQIEPALFEKVIDDLPVIIARDANGALQPFVAALFEDLPRASGPKRRLLCARILKLAAGLFSVKPGLGVERALQSLHSVSQRLVEAIPAGESDADVCGLMYARRDTPGSAERITFDGARHLVLAMEKIRDGTDPLLMLEATAANLGLVPIGVPGEQCPYDPVQHREIAGEAQTGDAVVFLEKGWLLEGQVIERAKVKKS